MVFAVLLTLIHKKNFSLATLGIISISNFVAILTSSEMTFKKNFVKTIQELLVPTMIFFCKFAVEEANLREICVEICKKSKKFDQKGQEKCRKGQKVRKN